MQYKKHPAEEFFFEKFTQKYIFSKYIFENFAKNCNTAPSRPNLVDYKPKMLPLQLPNYRGGGLGLLGHNWVSVLPMPLVRFVPGYVIVGKNSST